MAKGHRQDEILEQLAECLGMTVEPLSLTCYFAPLLIQSQIPLKPPFFEALEKTKLGKGGELWLVDAIVKLLKKRPIYAKKIEGTYYDTGSKIGYLKANVEMALRRPDLKDEFKKYLKNLKLE